MKKHQSNQVVRKYDIWCAELPAMPGSHVQMRTGPVRLCGVMWEEEAMENSKKMTINTDYLTISDVKHYLNIGQSAAYELSHRKDFPVCRFGSCIWVPREAFLVWVERHTHIPTSCVRAQ